MAYARDVLDYYLTHNTPILSCEDKMTEHGWNDPPLFSFSSLQSGSNKKSQMTKRVNHVVSVSSPDSSTSSALDPHKKKNTSIPPLLNSGLSPSGPPPRAPPPTAICTEEDKDTNVQDDVVENPGESEGVLTRESNEESENRTFDQVLASLAELTDKHCETVQKRTFDEIKRRLGILSKQWEEGKLSQPVQTQMTKLALALERGDSQSADSIHVALMVDHTSEVNQWMVGVKRLIATMK